MPDKTPSTGEEMQGYVCIGVSTLSILTILLSSTGEKFGFPQMFGIFKAEITHICVCVFGGEGGGVDFHSIYPKTSLSIQ